MNCSEETRLVAYLDGEMEDREMEALCAHIEGCGECRERLALLKRSYDALSVLDEVEVPAGFAEGVRRRASRRRFRMVYAFSAVSAAAAALLITITLAVHDVKREVIPARVNGSAAARDITPEEMAVVENLEILENYKLLSDLDILAEFDTLKELDALEEVAAI